MGTLQFLGPWMSTIVSYRRVRVRTGGTGGAKTEGGGRGDCVSGVGRRVDLCGSSCVVGKGG